MATKKKTTPAQTLRTACPDARLGWHLIGAGPARYGWATYTAAGAGRWLGSTAQHALVTLAAAPDLAVVGR